MSEHDVKKIKSFFIGLAIGIMIMSVVLFRTQSQFMTITAESLITQEVVEISLIVHDLMAGKTNSEYATELMERHIIVLNARKTELDGYLQGFGMGNLIDSAERLKEAMVSDNEDEIAVVFEQFLAVWKGYVESK